MISQSPAGAPQQRPRPTSRPFAGRIPPALDTTASQSAVVIAPPFATPGGKGNVVPSDEPELVPAALGPDADVATSWTEGDAGAALDAALADAAAVARQEGAAAMLEDVARRVRSGEIAVARGAATHNAAATLATVLASLLGERD